VASSGGRPCWAYAVIRQREHLDTGAHGPLHSVSRRPGYSRCVDPHSGLGLGSVCICYFELPEQIHTDQGAQFQSQLMGDIRWIWGVNQSQTTPYHPQGNGIVERNNRMLSYALRSLLLGRGQKQ